MHEDLFPYYESELLFLRQAGAEFAEKYPAEAGALKLGKNTCDDPHVERVLEGVALMGARIRRKLDDEFPELTQAMLGMLCPHMTAPVPPVGIIQFAVDQSTVLLTSEYQIPRESSLETNPVGGLPCKFKTCYAVELIPVKTTGAKISRIEETFKFEKESGGKPQAVLKMSMGALSGVTLSSLKTEKLRFYLNGAPLSYRLYELFNSNILCGEILWRNADGVQQSRYFNSKSITPAGFDQEEALLPLSRNTFDGYRLLHEYFAFQEKFLFIDLSVPQLFSGMDENSEFEICFYLNHMPSFVGEQQVSEENFLLGCTPIINLFNKKGEPFKTDAGKREYHIIPEFSRHEQHEVYCVTGVSLTDLQQNVSFPVEPFYSFTHSVNHENSLYWHTRQELNYDGAVEHYIQFSSLGFEPIPLIDSSISIDLICSNRNQIEKVPWHAGGSGQLIPEDFTAFGDIRVLTMQPEPIRTPLGRDDEFWNGNNNKKQWRGGYWRLISHLSLNYLSIEDGGIEALRALLQLYDIKGLTQHENMILGIADISTKPMGALVNGAYSRGLDIELLIDPDRFGGSSYILLTAVLDHFFARYATINSMIRLSVLENNEKRSILKRWPIRAGKQTIL